MTPIIEEKIPNDKYISIEEGQLINGDIKKHKNNYSRFISTIKVVLFLQLIIAIVYLTPVFITFKNEKDVELESVIVTDHIDEKSLENISYNLLNNDLMLETIVPIEIDTLGIPSTTPITSNDPGIISKDIIESSQQVDSNEEYVVIYEPEKQNDDYQTNVDHENVITSDIVDDKKESSSMEKIIDDMNDQVEEILDIGSTLLAAFSDALEKEKESKSNEQNDKVDDDNNSGYLDITDDLSENIDTTTDQHKELKQYCQNNNGVLTKITDVLWDASDNYYSFPYVCVLDNNENILNFSYDDINIMNEEKLADFE